MARISNLAFAPATAAAYRPYQPPLAYRSTMPALRLVAVEARPVTASAAGGERRYPGLGIAIALGFSAAVWSLAATLVF